MEPDMNHANVRQPETKLDLSSPEFIEAYELGFRAGKTWWRERWGSVELSEKARSYLWVFGLFLAATLLVVVLRFIRDEFDPWPPFGASQARGWWVIADALAFLVLVAFSGMLVYRAIARCLTKSGKHWN